MFATGMGMLSSPLFVLLFLNSLAETNDDELKKAINRVIDATFEISLIDYFAMLIAILGVALFIVFRVFKGEGVDYRPFVSTYVAPGKTFLDFLDEVSDFVEKPVQLEDIQSGDLQFKLRGGQVDGADWSAVLRKCIDASIPPNTKKPRVVEYANAIAVTKGA